MSENAVEAQNGHTEEVENGIHNYSGESEWVRPDNPVTLERLEWFRDQKLGLMMHWGPYSQIGMVESWTLSDEDSDWARNDVDWTNDYEEMKREYFALNKTFNPIRFEPGKWAEAAADGGFKYLIFTTKHHDGFCMWDTHTTDYRITGSDTPFHAHRYADVCKQVFDSFRDKGLAIAAYFSKADWHTPSYWAPGMERGRHMWRGPSYDPQEHPHLWEKFVSFTHEQIMELMTRYGRIDILWLDAGWVREGGRVSQDIRLGELVERARQTQPWLLSADRTVGGAYENYVTPEQTIPDRPLNVPWESCITIGTSFSFGFEDKYKSARRLVHILMEVVAKGGNLALNVGPQPDGRLPKGALRSMKELGAWMKAYGEAVYGTRICAPYFTSGCAFTRKGDIVYCTYLYASEDAQVSEFLTVPYTEAASSVELVGTDEAVSYTQDGSGLTLRLPASQLSGGTPIAHVFRIQS
ncbi:alpha-L-fucosidase [Paenibacillus sacheonensis]|uniref:alpha-L-fucosidase n=1 Tax=Paenibacillus sacheonensis TaxID=742054 RepID=A0A7X4YLN1_9BACL|nr:alpha-L-fucosidase [Paenibacillus sacheonensis]MBM7566040.1 alpha-L-fucosidase [Paenibacillus sacheonensis]NBC68648.1 alpha-L-fucosidase [Paenibacillus sacheonensis]